MSRLGAGWPRAAFSSRSSAEFATAVPSGAVRHEGQDRSAGRRDDGGVHGPHAGDMLAQTVLAHADSIQPGGEQRMTSTQWLHCLSGVYSGDDLRPLPKGWPTTGKVLSDRLKRLQPTLAARGVLIDSGRTCEGRYLEMTRRDTTPPPDEQTEAF